MSNELKKHIVSLKQEISEWPLWKQNLFSNQLPNVIADPAGSVIKIWTTDVEASALEQLKNMAKLPFIYKHIAVMPDVHAGIGATIGSVIATKGAVIPAATGVDLGCFTGDTKVPLLDGKDYEIKDLVDKGEFVVYSIKNNDRITTAKATAKLTRKDQPLVKVTLDNNESIRCTLDHQFMMRDGTYKEAQFLQPNDSLMPLYKKVDRSRYVLVQQPYSKKWQRAHWIVGRSGLMGDVPKFDNQRTIIHHQNFNESDNTPENLEFMGDGDHSRYHRSLVERNTYWHPDFERKRIEAVRRYFKSETGRIQAKLRISKRFKTWVDKNSEEVQEWKKQKGEMGKKVLVDYNKSEKGRAKSSEISSRVHDCPICGRKVKSYFGLYSHKKKCEKTLNHKVTSIEFLTECEDVYCLNVPDFGNFALSAGVFVHNCGMVSVKTNLTATDLPDDLKMIRQSIEFAIPVGFNAYKGTNHLLVGEPELLRDPKAEDVLSRHNIKEGRQSIAEQCGTLGGGNHFIEVCLDEHDNVWVMLHSGSRGIGNQIGRKFIELAKKDMERHFINLPDKDLAYLPEGTSHFDDYIVAVEWAQNYAKLNRRVMLRRVLHALSKHFPQLKIDNESKVVNCHHNYISREHHFGLNVWVTRKGAVSAKAGELGIIPGSMGAKSYIVEGLGNVESFHSCSHGAGRKMSRNKARELFTVDDHEKATHGVECRKDAGVIDETPMAYKNIDEVMNNQKDLVKPLHTLKQVICIKG